MLELEPAQQPHSSPSDRRREPRIDHPAPVEVRMKEGNSDIDFNAVLVNTSTCGLAIRHWRKDLAIGQQVLISCMSIGQIAAQVMWNWTVGPLVISGLRRIGSGHIPFTTDKHPDSARMPTNVQIRPWMLAVAVLLLAVASWYLGSKI